MKKRRHVLRKILLALLLALVIFVGGVMIYLHLPGLSMSQLNDTDSFKAHLLPVLTINPTDGYSVQQGAATDGEYAYFILENQKENLCSIWKVDMDGWKVVDSAFELPLDHGNDMTYNADTDRLVVCHNKPHYSWVSIINPDTLELEQTIPTTSGMYAIAYSAERDQYVIGLAGTYNHAILDSSFKYVKKYNGVDTGLTKQGMDCDENFIYFPQYKGSDGENIIMVYDWEGNFVNRIELQKNLQEVETLFHDGEDYYAAYYSDRSHAYRLKLTKES